MNCRRQAGVDFSGSGLSAGKFLSANAALLQARLAEHFVRPNGQPDYALTMACVTLVVFVVLIALAALGGNSVGLSSRTGYEIRDCHKDTGSGAVSALRDLPTE